MVLRHEEGVYTSLSLEMARLPLDESGNMLVPYRGTGGSYPTISATKVMQGDAPPHQLAALQNALVLVGTSALGLSDLRTTPLETGFPGVEAHANLLDAMLQATPRSGTTGTCRYRWRHLY